MVLIPAHGPDPDNPLDLFDDGDAWFQLLVAPAMLPVKPILMAQSGGIFEDVIGMLWEDGAGSLALHADPRYKVVVLRKAPVPWSWLASRRLRRARRGTGVVAVEFAGSEEAALDRCRAILHEWQPGTSYRNELVMTAADVRRAVKAG